MSSTIFANHPAGAISLDYLLLNPDYLLLTTHYLLLTVYCSLPTTHYSLLGAIAVGAGSLTLTDSLVRSSSADTGGGMLVTGGTVHVTRCVFELNSASISGGELHVEGGHIELGDRTALFSNVAPRGRSIYFLSSSSAVAKYFLPAPLARWLFISQGITSTLEPGAIDADYPFACSAGLVGASYDTAVQSGPQCSGPCPEGFSDTGWISTHVAIPCKPEQSPQLSPR